MDTKKIFWEGSLTWIPRSGLGRFKRIALRVQLRKEFKVLNHVRKYPHLYVRDGEYHCGIQANRELMAMGWPKWESQDIWSFHHNWYFNKRWNKERKARAKWRRARNMRAFQST